MKKISVESTAEAYLELLAARGVEYLFANAGTDFAPLIEAYAKRAGYDPIFQAQSGMMSVTGFPDGEPVKLGVNVIDWASGVHAAFGIMVALHERAQDLSATTMRHANPTRRHSGRTSVTPSPPTPLSFL